MIFVDTNIVLRLVDTSAAEHVQVRRAIEALEASGAQLVTGLEVLCETWVVATRPRDVNGLGWSVDLARTVVDLVRGRFVGVGDGASTIGHWLDVVGACHVSGKRAHDARIVALMLTHGVEEMLTLNVADIAGLPVRAITPTRKYRNARTEHADRCPPEADDVL